jgi:hypothetical protein
VGPRTQLGPWVFLGARYKGSSLVAGGKVTEQIRIRGRIFFG